MRLDLNKTDEELESEIRIAEKLGRRQRIRELIYHHTGWTIFYFLLACVSVYFIYVSVIWGASRYRLANGLKTDGYLVNSATTYKLRLGTFYDVAYSYKLNGQSYSGIGVLRSPPKSLNITVVYDPSDPNNSQIEGGFDSVEGIILFVIAGTFGLILWIAPYWIAAKLGKGLYGKLFGARDP